MNKLINRISPETSENRILHAGFSIILMSEEITQTLSGLSSDMIIFILSGSITIYSTKEEKKTIGEQYMIFLRSFENYTYDITLGSKIIIFFFDSLTMNELPYYQHPYGILPQPISKWIELKIVEPLYGFLELVGQYLENNFLNYPLYELKRTELFYLLKKLYRKEELDYLYGPGREASFAKYSCCRWRGYRCRSIRRLIRDETVCFAERLSGSRKLSYEYLSDRRVL